MKKLLVVAAMLVFGFTDASAQYGYQRDRDHYDYRQDRSSDINYLQREARERISEGIRRGSLNRREAHMLMNRYEQIEARERRFSHRGRLSPRETRILRDDLQRLMADTRRMSGRRGDQWAREHRHRY